MKKIWLFVGVAVCAFVFTGTAGEKHDDHDDDCGEEVEVFDRNIRISFESLPLDEGDQGFFVITATSEFESHLRVEGDGGELIFQVEGEIQLLDDDKFFIELEASTLVAHRTGEAEFEVETGLILVPGRQQAVTQMGEKTLMITAAYVEDGE